MINVSSIKALRLKRQHLIQKANKQEYNALFKDGSPVQSVYWSGFGEPPTLSFRSLFNDKEYNRERQFNRGLVLASLMLERATGQSYQSLLNRALTEELNMPFKIGWPNAFDENQPWGHVVGQEKIEKITVPESDFSFIIMINLGSEKAID